MMMKIQKSLGIWALAVLLIGITIVVCGKVPIRKRSLVGLGSGEPGEQRRPSKRTFCNAFTGCGRKRSDGSVPAKDYEYDHESSVENQEDPVDDLARDILAEARLWEALQARNSMRYPQYQKHGFSGRQKRTVHESDSSNSKENARNSY